MTPPSHSRKALVLAGGQGTRLRPLTYTVPKQLIPIANRPVIHYVLDHLAQAGIRDVGVVIAPETGDRIKEALAGHAQGLSFTYLVQEQPLGLAHTILVARDFLNDSPFVMYLGDNLIGQGIGDLIKASEAANADAAVLLKEVDDPSLFGVAVMDGAEKILRLVEKPKEAISKLALVGVYCFSPAVHEAVQHITPSWRGELEITDAIQYLLEKGYRVVGKRLENWWLDCGKKDDLLEANRRVLDEWVVGDLKGDIDVTSRIAGRVVVSAGAAIRESELRGPIVIGPGTVVEKSFIGPYTSIGGRCQIRESVLEHCVVLDGARIEGVARIADSVIGQHAVVRHSGQHRDRAVRFMIGDDAEVLL